MESCVAVVLPSQPAGAAFVEKILTTTFWCFHWYWGPPVSNLRHLGTLEP